MHLKNLQSACFDFVHEAITDHFSRLENVIRGSLNTEHAGLIRDVIGGSSLA